MKGLFLLILLVIISLTGAYLFRGQIVNYPVDVTITNNKGDALEAIANGKSGGMIHFTKLGDGQQYSYRISELSLWTRGKLLFFPEKSLPRKHVEISSSSPTAEQHRAGLLEDKKDLVQQIKLLKKKYKAAENQSMKESVIDDIKEMEIKLRELEYQISRHDYLRSN